MKKLTCSLTALCMLFTLAACGGGTPTEAPSLPASSVVEAVSTPQAEAVANTGADNTTIEQLVVVDEADVLIVFTDYNPEGRYGPEINVTMENNSDVPITVSGYDISINGLMVAGDLYARLPEEKSANETLSFSTLDLEASGITTIGVIEMRIRVQNTDTYEEIVDTGMFRVETSNGVIEQPAIEGEVLVSQDGLTVYWLGVNEEGWRGYEILVGIVNETDDETYLVQTRDESVNGIMTYMAMSAVVSPGKSAYTTISISEDNLAENNITDIEEIAFSIHTSGTSFYAGFDTPQITITP